MPHDARDAAALRREIDALNEELLALLSRRGDLVCRIAALGKVGQAPEGRDPLREDAMLRALKARNEGPYSEAEIEAVFRAIFDASLALKSRAR